MGCQADLAASCAYNPEDHFFTRDFQRAQGRGFYGSEANGQANALDKPESHPHVLAAPLASAA